MKNSQPSTLLGALEQLHRVYGAEDTEAKLELLQSLDESKLQTADEVSRLHDVLCFMRAYPDNRKILTRVEYMLTGFANRKDLQRYRLNLSDTGIAGTRIHYRFHWKTAKWLYDHWPEGITIDWVEFENPSALEELWPLVLPPPALETLEHMSMSPRKWIETLKKPDETDAAFLIRIFARWHAGEAVREKSYDDLDVPVTLLPVVGSPSRTHAQVKPKKPAYGAPVFHPKEKGCLGGAGAMELSGSWSSGDAVTRHRAAHGARLDRHDLGAVGDHQVALGLAIELVDGDAEGRLRPVEHLGAEGLAAAADGAQLCLPALGRAFHRAHDLQRRRRQEGVAYAEVGKQLEGLFRIELGEAVGQHRHAVMPSGK